MRTHPSGSGGLTKSRGIKMELSFPLWVDVGLDEMKSLEANFLLCRITMFVVLGCQWEQKHDSYQAPLTIQVLG